MMSNADICRAMALANQVGERYFNEPGIDTKYKAGALSALHELIRLLNEEPETDPSTNTSGGQNVDGSEP